MFDHVQPFGIPQFRFVAPPLVAVMVTPGEELQGFFVTGFLGNPLFDERAGRSQKLTGTGPGLFDRGEGLLQFQFTYGPRKAGQEANPDDLGKKSEGEESREQVP